MSRSRCTVSMVSAVKSRSPFLFFGIEAAVQCCSGLAFGSMRSGRKRSMRRTGLITTVKGG